MNRARLALALWRWRMSAGRARARAQVRDPVLGHRGRAPLRERGRAAAVAAGRAHAGRPPCVLRGRRARAVQPAEHVRPHPRPRPRRCGSGPCTAGRGAKPFQAGLAPRPWTRSLPPAAPVRLPFCRRPMSERLFAGARQRPGRICRPGLQCACSAGTGRQCRALHVPRASRPAAERGLG